MARMDFKWDEPKLDLYDNVDPENILTSLPDEYKNSEKPLIVFLTSDLPDDAQTMKNVENTTFRDENVAIGATMFSQVRMNGLKIKDSHPYWKLLGGHELPRMVVVDAAGAKVGSVEGSNVSASKVFALMKKAASRTYKASLDTIVKETKTILTEIDQIDAKIKALETKKAKSTVDKGGQWAKEEEALKNQLAAVEERENVLKKKWNDEKKVTKA
jgi:hypothetical protein